MAFSFVMFFYFIVSFHKEEETITKKLCKVQQHTPCTVGSEHNVVLVIQFFVHEPSTMFLLQFFSGE